MPKDGDDKVKVLVCGPVRGAYRALSERLASLQRGRAGPFDLCLCVGPFRGSNDDDDDDDDPTTTSFPLPVYFYDDPDDDDPDDDADGVRTLSGNLHRLRGGADLVSLPHDGSSSSSSSRLIVAYARPSTAVGSPAAARLETRTRHPSYVGCDVLLTSAWGQGAEDPRHFPSDDVDPPPSDAGSYDAAELAAACRPRYHFSCSADGRYRAAVPFANPPPARHVCRFVSLGPAATPADTKRHGKARKWLHAVGVVPLVDAAPADLRRRPPDAVACPYTDAAYGRDGGGDDDDGGDDQRSLSAARSRRLLAEDEARERRDGGASFRWTTTGGPGDRKRRRRNDDDEDPAPTPDNKCLYVRGADRLDGGALTELFRSRGGTRVRRPPGRSYGFVEFATHDEAAACLRAFRADDDHHDPPRRGETVYRGTRLTLRWSAGGAADARSSSDPPPKRARNPTAAEAAGSDTLWLRLPPDASDAVYERARSRAERALERAVNEGVEENERATVATEPALAVQTRRPARDDAPHRFLRFASRAAASVAVAALTGDPDGGVVVALDDDQDDQDVDDDERAWRDIARRGGARLHWAKGRSTAPPAPRRAHCWFCLGSPDFEEHLVVTTRERCYVALPKGALDPFHALVVPKAHAAEDDDDEEATRNEMRDTIERLRRSARRNGDRDLFVFEQIPPRRDDDENDDDGNEPKQRRPRRLYHAHLQCVPVPSAAGVGTALLRAAADHDVTLEKLAGDGDPFVDGGRFRAEIYGRDGDAPVARYRTVATPPQFGREVAAAVLGKPEAANWRSCSADKALETRATDDFRSAFADFCDVKVFGTRTKDHENGDVETDKETTNTTIEETKKETTTTVETEKETTTTKGETAQGDGETTTTTGENTKGDGETTTTTTEEDAEGKGETTTTTTTTDGGNERTQGDR